MADMQMPATDAGPAPVPYGGPDQSAGNPSYDPPMPDFHHAPGADFLAGTPAGNAVQQSQPFPATVAPPELGSPDGIYAGGDADAGGRDDVSGTVAGAVAAAEARYAEYEALTHTQGSMSGDLMDLPPVPAAAAPADAFLYPKPGDEPFDLTGD